LRNAFRYHKLIRIHVACDYLACGADLACQPTGNGTNAARKIQHTASFAETCLDQHSACGCTIDLVEQSEASRPRFSNVKYVHIAGSPFGAFRHASSRFVHKN
jgi:hypothetical protein